MSDAGDILKRLSDLYRERNAVYKDNYKHIGPVMAGFFPDGITLRTPEDFIRFHLFLLALVKLTRYTNNWWQGHSDSLQDTSVYAAMLDAVDAQVLGRNGIIRESTRIKPGLQTLAALADPQNMAVSGEARRIARIAVFEITEQPDTFGEDWAAFQKWLEANGLVPNNRHNDNIADGTQ